MTSTQTTTKNNHYFRGLVALAALAMVAAMLLTPKPTYASTTFTVNLADDRLDASPGNGTCSVVQFGAFCTLRAAIQEANATPGPDTINFNVSTGSDGIATISPEAPLPVITQTVTIDGYTQPGASPNTRTVGNDAVLKVQLDGTQVPGDNGLEIITADSSVIRGLAINRFGTGVAISGDSIGNRVEGNFIGTDPTGTLDKGNQFDAVALGNGASESVIGGTTPAALNVLSGNGLDGLTITSSQRATVFGNRVGTTANGTGALGNAGAGVRISGSNNSVGDPSVLTDSKGANTIAFNGDDGVVVQGATSTGNTITDNSIFSNAGIGIDLVGGFESAAGVTANDPGDVDGGANNLQNFPVLTSARTVSGKTTITGKLSSTPNSGHNIQFFANPSGGEGKKFIGERGFVATDGSGKATFTFSPANRVPVGQTITATVAASSQSLSTSEFSAPRKVTT